MHRGWGLWIEAVTLKCCSVTRGSPCEGLGSQDRPGGGGGRWGKLTLLALGGELGCETLLHPLVTRPIPQSCLRKHPLWLKNWAKVQEAKPLWNETSQILPTETTVVP